MSNASANNHESLLNEKRTTRRDSIVAAAADLFVENGIKKTSIAKVMDKAGLTRELFYYYFDGKEDLISSVVDYYAKDAFRIIDEWVEKAPELIDSNTPAEEQAAAISGIVRAIIAGGFDYPGSRLSVVMESGLLMQCASSVCGYLAARIRETKSYEYYARVRGDVSSYNTEAVLYGVACLMVVHPELTDNEIGGIIGETFRVD